MTLQNSSTYQSLVNIPWFSRVRRNHGLEPVHGKDENPLRSGTYRQRSAGTRGCKGLDALFRSGQIENLRIRLDSIWEAMP